MTRKYFSLILTIFILKSASGKQVYEEVAESLNINHTYGEGYGGGGVSFYDFNNDGWDDLTMATADGEPIHFYKNINGTFVRLDPAPVENLDEVKQVLWIDFDNDGDADLFVTSFSQNKLYENMGQFLFQEVTADVNLPTASKTNFGATWGDYDRDGWLDLYVTEKEVGDDFKQVSNHLYRNIGGTSFNEVTQMTNSADSSKAPFCATFLDINNNGWQDLYIAQDRLQQNSLLKNVDGGFYDIGEIAGADLEMNAMCVTVGDFNNDQLQDIYVSNTPHGNALFKNNGDETFDEIAEESGVGFYETGWSSSFFDYDNDGFLDLYVCSMNDKNHFYRNKDGSDFELLSDFGFEKDTVTSFSNAIGDFNNDGYPDIVVNNSNFANSTLWKNPGSANNFLKLRLTGTYSNYDGIGTRMVAYCESEIYQRYTHSATGYLAQNSQYELIGISNNPQIDSLKVYWLSGLVDVFYDVEVNKLVHIIEGESITELQPKLNKSDTVTLCEGDSVLLHSGYFSSRLTYNWSDGKTGIINFASQPGPHFVELVDANGLKYMSDTIEVLYNENPIVSLNELNDISCYGLEDGMIRLSIEKGLEPYNTQWSNGSSGTTIENLDKGIHQVTVTDQRGCHTEEAFEIQEPDSITVEVTIDPESQVSNGSIQLSCTGGTPPYTFLWSHTELNSNYIDSLRAGNYTVQVIDRNTCEESISIELTNELVTSISDQSRKNQYMFYPNPANDFMIIERSHDESAEMLLIDELGKVSLQRLLKKRTYIDLSNVKAGLYILIIDGKPSSRLCIN